MFALLGLRLARSGPDKERLRHCWHGEDVGDWRQSQYRDLDVLPRWSLTGGDDLSHGVAVKGLCGRCVGNGHAFGAILESQHPNSSNSPTGRAKARATRVNDRAMLSPQ